MARKQQSGTSEKRLEDLRARRVALEKEIRDVQSHVLALQKEFSTLQDQKQMQQHRRKLRYPTVS